MTAINGFNSDCSTLSASFKYDALGRRIQKSVTNTVNVTRTTDYLYDGLDIIQEIEDGMVSANYIRALNIDEPLARIKADGTIRYYQQDALGSVIALTDEVGTLKTQYSYDPFGNVSVTGESSDNPFQYTGRESDGTGLYYYRARYYSPELQRFISEDPIGLAGGSANYYSYTLNNPVNFIDPLGLLLGPPPPDRKPPSKPCVYGCHPPSPPPAPPRDLTREQKLRACEINCHLACEGLYLACGLHSLPTSMSTCAFGCFFLCHALVDD